MRWKIPACLIAGALLPLAFAPFNLYSIGFFAPAVLLFCWLRVSPAKAALLGFLFAFGFFGAGVSWMYHSIHWFGNASATLAVFLTLCAVAILSIHFIVFGYLFRKIFQRKKLIVQCLCAFPALWVLIEITNAAIFGFPWLLLGYTQQSSPLSGFVPLFGVYGLSLITSLIAGALVLLFSEKKRYAQITAAAIILLLIIIGLLLENHNWTKPNSKTITVSIIQGNIPQKIKWDPNFAIENINVYKQLTLKHIHNELIVWPEGAIPVTVQSIPDFIQSLDKIAKQNQASIIFGAPSEDKKTNQYYNAVFMIGKSQGRYLKRHLVPFGEYLPFSKILGPIAKHFNLDIFNLSRGPKNQSPLSLNHIHIATFICYEVIFPQEVLDAAQHTQLLLNVSDDSWFGRSIALTQQIQMAQMRALETGRYMLVASNTGISGVISPHGKLLSNAPIDQRMVITRTVKPMYGETPLMVWAYYPIFVLIAVLLLAGILL